MGRDLVSIGFPQHLTGTTGTIGWATCRLPRKELFLRGRRNPHVGGLQPFKVIFAEMFFEACFWDVKEQFPLKLDSESSIVRRI
jgi:hypothetical protein